MVTNHFQISLVSFLTTRYVSWVTIAIIGEEEWNRELEGRGVTTMSGLFLHVLNEVMKPPRAMILKKSEVTEDADAGISPADVSWPFLLFFFYRNTTLFSLPTIADSRITGTSWNEIPVNGEGFLYLIIL